MFRRSVYALAVALCAVGSGTAAASSQADGWTSSDIGATGAPGSSRQDGTTYSLTGAGLDVWGRSDQFHFAYRFLLGDGEIVARVASVDNVAPWTKAGVMMRETLAPDSKHAFMLVSPGKGLAFQRRASTAGLSTHTAGGGGTAPYWVKLVRRDGVFTASRSLDGVEWTVVGTQSMAMSAGIYVGLAIGSHVTGTLATATFDGVAIRSLLPAGWSTTDVGSVGAEGSAAHAGGTFVLDGSGLDVWGTSDRFHFTYRRLSGDGSIVARVASVENVAPWTKAGVMMRETLAPNSRHGFMLVSPGKGLAFQRRPSIGGTSLHTSGGAGTAPVWLRLERAGNLFTASKSPDGVTWTVVGTQTIAMAADILVGVAIGSHVTGVLATASFERVSVDAAAPSAADPPSSDPPTADPPTADSPAPGTPADGTTLRILTWNVRHGGTRSDGIYDPANTVDWILRMDPHVAALNEFDNATQAARMVSLLEARSGLDWEYHYDNRGNVVVTRLPWVEKDVCVVNASVGRKATFMTVLANGRPVSIYSAHLSLSQSERIAEVTTLKACAENKVQSRILAGDYNMQPGSTEYNAALVHQTDAWKRAKELGRAVNYPGNCDGCTKSSRIDYVFTSAGATTLTLTLAQIVDTRNAAGVMASDHKPLLVVYQVH